MSFAENLKAARVKKLFSQAELAQLVGVNQSAIARFELGDKFPNVILGHQIAKKLDVTVEQLVDGQTVEVKSNADEESELV